MAGLLTNIRNWLSSTSKEAPASPGEGKYGSIIGTQSYAFGGFATFSNQPSKQVDQYAGWVRVCVNFLANQVGRVPVAARVTDTEDRKAYKKALRNYYETKGLDGNADRPERRQFVPATIRLKSIVGGHLTNEDDLEYLEEDHPLIRLLRDPNGPQTGQQFWPLFMTYYYLVGRAYIWAPKGEDGLPKALWVLPAHWVQPFASQDSDRLRDYYEVRSQFSPEPVRFDADEVIEFGDWHPSNPLVPDSPVAGAAHEIDVHAMIRIAQYQGLQNGADIGGTLELPADADPSDPAIQRWLSSFQSAAQGIYNFGKPIVLLPGTKYTPREAAKEVAYQEAHEISRRNIMAHFGLDESLMGFSKESTHATADVNDKRLRYQIVNPMQTKLAGLLTERLARDFGEDIRIMYPHGGGYQDPASRRADFQAAMAYPGGPACTINEVRTGLLDLEPIDDERGDQLPKGPSATWPGDEPPQGAGGMPAGQGPKPDQGPGGRQAQPEQELQGADQIPQDELEQMVRDVKSEDEPKPE